MKKNRNLSKFVLYSLMAVFVINTAMPVLAVSEENQEAAKPGLSKRWIPFHRLKNYFKETYELGKKVSEGKASPEEIKDHRKRVAVILGSSLLLYLMLVGGVIAGALKYEDYTNKIRKRAVALDIANKMEQEWADRDARAALKAEASALVGEAIKRLKLKNRWLKIDNIISNPLLSDEKKAKRLISDGFVKKTSKEKAELLYDGEEDLKERAMQFIQAWRERQKRKK